MFLADMRTPPPARSGGARIVRVQMIYGVHLYGTTHLMTDTMYALYDRHDVSMNPKQIPQEGSAFNNA